MSRMVFCRKYQQEMEGLPQPPFPGPTGDDIFENVSRQAWEEWQQHQTRLINEKGLSTLDPEHRKYLITQMKKFFNNEPFDIAEGYVPEDQSGPDSSS